MAVLHHYAFCPHSRFVRLSLGEMGLEAELAEERPWDREEDLLRLNPAGATPILTDGEITAPGPGIIAEYLDETRGPGLNGSRLLPPGGSDRIEVRRLTEWFNVKFFEEVTGHLVTEKIFKRFARTGQGGGSPDMAALRAARTNLRHHLRYIGFLAATRNWLAGDRLTYADLAAAAHLSTADYLGDVPWDEDRNAKDWYARVKSRPAFRALLADRLPGIAPPAHYADLDF